MYHIPQIIEACGLSTAVGGGIATALSPRLPFILPLTRSHQRWISAGLAAAAACEAVNLLLGGFWNV